LYIWHFLFLSFAFLKVCRYLCCMCSSLWWFLSPYYSMMLHSSILGVVRSIFV
jgi:hypothetical protein